MSVLQRLVFVLVVLLSSWLPTSSYAVNYPAFPATAVPPPAGSCTVAPCSQYITTVQSGVTLSGTTATLSCQAAAVKYAQQQPGYGVVYGSNTETVCITNRTAVGGTQNFPITIQSATPAVTTYSCPANSSLSGQSCTCAYTSFYQVGGSCVATPPCIAPAVPTFDAYWAFQGCKVPANSLPPPDSCAAKTGTSAGYYSAPYANSIGGPEYTYLCETGCTINVLYEIGVSGMKYGNATFTGATCTGDPSSLGTSASSSPSSGSGAPPLPGQPAPTSCKKGEYTGTVSGVSVCVPASSSPTPVAVAGKTDGAKTSAGVGVQIPNAPTGATQSKESTTCQGSGCVTVTTYTNDAGSVVGTSSESESSASFCAENPTASICKTSSFSGACKSAPACDGDAIQCAIASFDQKTSCLLTDSLTPDADSQAVANAAKSGADGTSTDAMKTSAGQVSVGSFNVSGSGWTRSCPPDPVINMGFGKVATWTLPLSKLCDPLKILSNAAVALTLLGSLVWVLGFRKG